MAASAGGVVLKQLSRALENLSGGGPISVAFSGGPDSAVLLEALARLRDEGRLRRAPLRALHVNHGLQQQAGDWTRQCRRWCRERGIDFLDVTVSVSRQASESLEDAARRARYQALGDCLETDEILCTGHHAQDQAETLLLQLLRGAGPRGLAAMPVLRRLHAGWLARPLLAVERDVIRACAREWGLAVVEDPANQDPRFARTHVRRLLLEQIQGQFPAAVKTLNRSARLQAAASAAIDALAGLDLQQCRGAAPGTLAVGALAQLPAPRCLEVLRRWLRDQNLAMPSQTRLHELCRQMLTAAVDRLPVVAWHGAEVRRYRGLLYALGPRPEPPRCCSRRWSLDEALELPWGRLWTTAATGQGLKLDIPVVEIRLRRPGERCRPAGAGEHHRRLKHLLQEHGVPPWERPRLPMIWVGADLAAVAGLFVCEGFQARPGAPGRVIHWQPR